MVNCLVQLIGTCSNCARVAYNSQFAESKLDRVTGGFCGILLNRLITAGSGSTAPLMSTISFARATYIHLHELATFRRIDKTSNRLFFGSTS